MFRQIRNLFRSKAPRTRTEVADLIERMTRGEDRGWEWEDFMYAKYGDPAIATAQTEMTALYSTGPIGDDAPAETHTQMMRCANQLRQDAAQ